MLKTLGVGPTREEVTTDSFENIDLSLYWPVAPCLDSFDGQDLAAINKKALGGWDLLESSIYFASEGVKPSIKSSTSPQPNTKGSLSLLGVQSGTVASEGAGQFPLTASQVQELSADLTAPELSFDLNQFKGQGAAGPGANVPNSVATTSASPGSTSDGSEVVSPSYISDDSSLFELLNTQKEATAHSQGQSQSIQHTQTTPTANSPAQISPQHRPNQSVPVYPNHLNHNNNKEQGPVDHQNQSFSGRREVNLNTLPLFTPMPQQHGPVGKNRFAQEATIFYPSQVPPIKQEPVDIQNLFTPSNQAPSFAGITHPFNNFATTADRLHHNPNIGRQSQQGKQTLGFSAVPSGSRHTSTSGAMRGSKSHKPKKQIDKNSDEYKRRRERNNVAVRKSREKAKVRGKETEKKVQELNRENQQLQDRVNVLDRELEVLKNLLRSTGIPDSEIQKAIEQQQQMQQQQQQQNQPHHHAQHSMVYNSM